MGVRQKPQKICDEEHQMLIERVCAIDVGRRPGMVRAGPARVAAGSPDKQGVWEVPATGPGLGTGTWSEALIAGERAPRALAS
jgi:hypothetical protein